MSLRSFVIAAAISAITSTAGCCGPSLTPTTGFHLEIGRASVAPSPALVRQLEGPMAISPIGSMAGPSMSGYTGQVVQRMAPTVTQFAQESIEPSPLTPPRVQAGPVSSCTLEAVCQRLDALQAQLRALEVRKLQPGPK